MPLVIPHGESSLSDPVWQNDDGSYWQYDNQLSSFDPMNIRPDLRAAELQHRQELGETPTTLAQARERGYFGNDLSKYEDVDPFISRLFQSKGLNEQQAVAAAIQGKQAHQAKFGQGYTTGSSLSGIFNDFIFPAAGVAATPQLETMQGWTRHDAEARAKRAADIEHGGDFGSATGLGQILSYQSNLGGNILEAWKNDPERMLLGINTPAESEAWGALTGKDYRPTVDMMGGNTSYDTQSAKEKGIDTQSGEAMHQIAKMVVGRFGSQALNGLFSAGGSAGGSTGDSALIGGASNDTLGGETLFPGESATSGSAGGSQGGGMWDLVDEVGFDPGGEGIYNAPLVEDTSTGAFDQFGMNNPNTGFPDQGFNPGGSWLDSLKQYGQQGMDVYNKLKAIPGLAGILGRGAGGKSGSTGGGILDSILKDPLGSAFNASPFLLAMAEANRQGNKTDPILARLSGLADRAGSNEDGLLSSVTGPYNRQTMAGRDALMSDQSLRGVRGSSFGDQSLTSYDTTRSQGLGELTGSTQAKSIGLQGGLLNQLLAGQTQAATSRNLLLGAGLNASGKLFQPQSDPFGLQNLLGLK